MLSSASSLKWAWFSALTCFTLAATTGAILRFGMLYGLPEGLFLHNVRHAHSHLMYFGWATPALMALIASNLPRLTGRPNSILIQRLLRLVFAVALLAYLAFLAYGYQPAPVGKLRIPLSTIGAGLNVLVWYGFVIYYWRATRGAARYLSLRLWDAALAFLILSSMGAWGIALSTVAGISTPLLSLGLTHLFLDLFADGWFLLAILGAAFLGVPAKGSARLTQFGENLIVIGLPLTFLLSLPANSLPIPVSILASLSAFLAASGLLVLLTVLVRALRQVDDQAQRWLWTFAAFFLTLKALAFLVVALPEGAEWSTRMGLRISYLHWLLLGGVTVGLFAAARRNWGSDAAPAWGALLVVITILLLSLVPITRLWPSSWGGRWTLVMASWATLGPIVVSCFVLARAVINRRKDVASSLAGQLTTRI